ncbi:hypothetical protein PybrP1_002311 [[Pythium] brassicae (nom. inval.)]|nr:hypothetical protein PybrP1_002311 [[Pythium] brassicae (nom. inval.)]
MAAAHDGSHGILYLCGEKTCGVLVVSESLLGRRVRRIDGGYDRFAVVVDSWELECEQHGDSAEVLEHETVIGGLQHVKIHRVAVGKSHRLALSLDGRIFSWGTRDSVLQSAELGQVGVSGSWLKKSDSKSQRLLLAPEQDPSRNLQGANQSSAVCQPLPVHTSTELFFRSLACGRSHSAAVTDKGDLYTWGRNFEGQLGHFSTSLSKEHNALVNGICAWPKFVRVFLSKPRVADVSCGDMFTVVLLESGAIYRFGERFTGVARRPNTKTGSNLHLLIKCGNDGAGFVGIACGYAHALAVTSSGQLYAWGWNNYGQLGLGPTSSIKSSATPVLVPAPELEWTKAYAGGNYSAAISTAGELHTWGNGKHGQLAHGPGHMNCEFAPRRVDTLQRTVVSAVVCTARNLYVFASTQIAEIVPKSGEITGGYELRIKGSGIWSSDDLTVRFVPLTEGRLPRGSLGVYDESTHEIVCQVPKFSLAGEFAVEIAMDGKHFTTNGQVFSAFKRPRITCVSISETRLSGGEEAVFELVGVLPESCREPIIRVIPCAVDFMDDAAEAVKVFTRRPDMDPVDVVAVVTCMASDDSGGSQYRSSSSDTTHTVRFLTPGFALTREVLPCALEISYNGGLHFIPVVLSAPANTIDSDSATRSSQPPQQHIVWYHDAHVQRIRPNSFVMTALPQTVCVDADQLLQRCGGFSVVARVDMPTKDSDTVQASVSATLKIQSVNDTRTSMCCVVPPLTQWEYTDAPFVSGEQGPTIPAVPASRSICDWWRRVPRTGFAVELSVSMNGGKSALPYDGDSGKAQLYALPAVGSLWSVFPPSGEVSGGAKVSISGDFFHFDTPDAVVSLRWRDKHFQVPASCQLASPEQDARTDGVNSSERRVVFHTPPLPFPGDRETAAAIAEGHELGASEEVDVFIALDGVHFTEKGLKFVYCASPGPGLAKDNNNVLE